MKGHQPTQDDTVTDERLIIDAQDGSQEAFGQLYKRYLDPVYRYIYYRIGNHQDVEDLTDTVFIKAWKAIGKYQLQGVPFLAWLYRIARNVVIDFRRSKKIEQVDIETQYGLPAEGDLPEDTIAKTLKMNGVMEAMQRLDETQREVLVLRFLMGMSHQEVADVLGKQSGAIRVTQLRALKALRAMLLADGIDQGNS